MPEHNLAEEFNKRQHYFPALKDDRWQWLPVEIDRLEVGFMRHEVQTELLMEIANNLRILVKATSNA